MKRIIIISISIFFTLNVQATDSLLVRQEKVFNYLMNKSDNTIGLTCGWAGSHTDNVDIFVELLEGRRYDLIVRLINSDIYSTKYLAIQTLYYLRDIKQYSIDSLTQENINLIINNKKFKVSLCSGCGVGDVYSIGQLIKEEKAWTVVNFKKWLKEKII